MQIVSTIPEKYRGGSLKDQRVLYRCPRRMQPGVTVVLATVWLYANVVGTASLNSSRFSLDQYSPLAPHHELYQRVGGQLDWKDQSPVGNQPFDLPIDPRRSSSASPWQSFESKYLDKDPFLARTKGNSAADDFSPLVEDKRHRKEFTEQKIDGVGTKDPDQPAGALSELEDPFVADDTFQDQGPGSMEIYKLDLLREKSLLSSTPLTRYLLKGKGKAPKKTNVAGWKTKTTDYKSTSPKMFHKQSNSFDDLSTEVPPNSDPFSIGGVPELQVGCEGLEASDHKLKRSIEYRQRNTSPREAMDAMAGVTPISLDLDYDFSSVEEEETDELLRLKKLETTTKGIKQNRGDMEATRYSDFLDDKRLTEKLPVRGDLGKSNAANSTDGTAQEASDSDKAKREAEEAEAKSADSSVTAHQRRRILWLDSSADEQVRDGGRTKRGIWGFGEDEGVVSSDELQTENQRRRQSYEWRRKEEERRRLEEAQRREHTENRTNSEVERIRQEYERALEERTRQEEERQRRLRQESRRRPQEPDDSRRYERPQTSYDEQRRQQEEASRRRQQQEQDRRNVEQRRREWMLKTRQAEEEMRRQQSRNEPSNLLHPVRATPNESRPYADPEGRSRDRNSEQKLREYMQRNRPINPADRQREEELRRRQEEERKLQEYVRRNQPVHAAKPSWDSRSDWPRYPGPEVGRKNHGPSAPLNIDPRNYVDERWRTEAARKAEEERIERERQQEQLRKEALRREEETRRLQARRYEEQRRRMEAERREADRTRQLLIEEHARRSQAGRTRQENRPSYDDRARFEEHRRRQDTSLIPTNSVRNQSSRAMEMERQRQELERQRQERWRLEAERRRQEESRAKEAREREERVRVIGEYLIRQEEARLNALPVSAKIIVQPAVKIHPIINQPRIDPGTPNFLTRLDPNSPGIPVLNFSPSATQRAPVQSPPVCASAVVQCCPSNSNRMVRCFEAMGCPGVNWDANPCRIAIINAARQQILKFYEQSEGNN